MPFSVHKRDYGVIIYDDEMHEQVAVQQEDLRQLVTDLSQHLETEIDYNTVIMGAGDGRITHTYSPHCPAGCSGQMEECYYRPGRTHTDING